MSIETMQTRVCVTGGGPAGMMMGYLLARAGVDVVVLEKHADFLRDFRGDTIHSSTLENMNEMGLLQEFLKRPHQKLTQFKAEIGNKTVTFADFRNLPATCKYVAFMPQWDFLNFMAAEAARYPAFHLRMQAEVTNLIEEDGKVVGVRAKTPEGELDVRAELTIGADGRHSTVRTQAGFTVEDIGAPVDVLWLRVSRKPNDPGELMGRFGKGGILIMINRGEYWQCAYVIPKGGFADLQKQGLDIFREKLAGIAPFIADRVDELADWDRIKLLTVTVDRLKKWYRDGLLCIGDSAHAMSPVGGVGINLAIQDAVAAANKLVPILSSGTGKITTADLAAIQDRRLKPTQKTQAMQVFIQNRFMNRVLKTGEVKLPFPMRVILNTPFLKQMPGRIIALGFLQEHIQTPDVLKQFSKAG